MDSQRIQFRCPNCGTEGKARAELLGRRVACKHCSHIFRAQPDAGEDAAPAGHPFASQAAPSPSTVTSSSGRRVEALEAELWSLRNERDAREAESADRLRAAQASILDLERRLADPRPDREGALLRELEAARDRLDAATEALRRAGEDRDQAIREAEARALIHSERERSLAGIVAELRSRAEAAQAHDPAEVERLRAEARSLRDERDRARQEARSAEALRQEVEMASLEAGRLHAEEVESLRVGGDSAREVESLRQLHDAAVADRDRLQAEVESLRLQYADQASIQSTMIDDIAASPIREIAELRRECDRLRAEAETLMRERDAAAEEVARKEAALAGREAIEADLRDEMARVARDAAERVEASDRDREAAWLRDRRSLEVELEQTRNSLREECDRIRAEADELASRCEAADAATARIDDALAAQRAETESARAELAAEAERARGLEDELARLRSEIEFAGPPPQDRSEEVSRLEAELASARNEANEALSRAAEVAERLQILQNEASAASDRAAQAQQFQNEANEARARIGDLAEQVRQLQNEANAAREQAQQFQNEANQAREQAQQAEQSRNEANAAQARLAEVVEQAQHFQNEANAAREQAERIRSEADAARARLAEVIGQVDLFRNEAKEAREQAQRFQNEANAAREQAERERAELRAEIERLSAATPRSEPGPAAGADTPEALAEAEAARRRDVDEAVKGAWVDFERRLSETQAKLKAANARADLLEAEARQAMEQLSNFQKGVEEGTIGTVDDVQASMTNIRIMFDRGGPRLSWADAEARLGIARQLAGERKDKALIDRINKVAEKVRVDIDNRNVTLAESLIRGMEIEVGLDPGGWSIGGLKIFRPSPSILSSLGALSQAFDRVMRQGDRGAIRATIQEMRTVLGDQAGLPEIRRPGRVPKVKRPIAEADAARLFLDALEGENWLMRPILANRNPPDTSLTTYACLVGACADARPAVARHLPDRLELLDRVLQATAQMLTRRQQPDGHFPFLDPRGKASRFASVVEAMVARQPDAVKDGWVVAVDPTGAAQVETGFCGSALAGAAAATNKAEWADSAARAADWALGQPNLPNFLANAYSLRLISLVHLARPQEKLLGGMIGRLALGLFPGQAENGRWIDASSAQTPNHLAIVHALQDAAEAFPKEGHDEIRQELSAGLDRAVGSLIQECSALGVPANGSAIHALVRQRDHAAAAGQTINPRVTAAILDTATVIQELCRESTKVRLGVSPDLLAALVHA